ncbi:hypothetical protein Pint_27639 [Pistacia integerrima]|uniref:Uncharacterized protein n=1 Tax=Pistacia integerrima TaxID=434235 RepID=A0ACC0YNI2_9ROSI|nr:hypothetical protein Pint_27639 [Pistacia integerrima]
MDLKMTTGTLISVFYLNCAPICTLLSACMSYLWCQGRFRLFNHYANLGEVSFSCSTSDQIQNKNVYACNSMVYAYVHSGNFWKAYCFSQFLLLSSLQPDFYIAS